MNSKLTGNGAAVHKVLSKKTIDVKKTKVVQHVPRITHMTRMNRVNHMNWGNHNYEEGLQV